MFVFRVITVRSLCLSPLLKKIVALLNKWQGSSWLSKRWSHFYSKMGLWGSQIGKVVAINAAGTNPSTWHIHSKCNHASSSVFIHLATYKGWSHFCSKMGLWGAKSLFLLHFAGALNDSRPAYPVFPKSVQWTSEMCKMGYFGVQLGILWRILHDFKVFPTKFGQILEYNA